MTGFLEDSRSRLQGDLEGALDDLAERRTNLVRRLSALVDQEAELRTALGRARDGIPGGSCPDCWVEDGERVQLKHEREYRSDRIDDNYSCSVCGNTYHEDGPSDED